MIIKVKTPVFCDNFMGTETFTQWHVYARMINLCGIYFLFIYFQLIISVLFMTAIH